MDVTYEPWLKLARAYVILGYQNKACDILIKGSELNPDKWEIQRDMCILSANCQQFEKLLTSYNKLLDLNSNYFNSHILNTLAKGVAVKNCSGPFDLRETALTLFERLSKTDSSKPELWALYGMVTAYADNVTERVRKQTVIRLQKSIATATRDPMWFKNCHSVNEVLVCSEMISYKFISCCEYFQNSTETDYLLQIIIVFLNKIIEKVQEYHYDVIKGGIQSQFEEKVSLLETNKLFLEQMKLNKKEHV